MVTKDTVEDGLRLVACVISPPCRHLAQDYIAQLASTVWGTLKALSHQTSSHYALATFSLRSRYVLTTFSLRSHYILATFSLHSRYVLTTFSRRSYERAQNGMAAGIFLSRFKVLDFLARSGGSYYIRPISSLL